MNLRRILIAGTIGVGAALALASAAWACTNVKNPAYVTLENPSTATVMSSGLAGAQVTVTGHAFDPGPIVVTWRDPATNQSTVLTPLNGPVVAQGAAGEGTFSRDFIIPAVAPNSYYIQGFPNPLPAGTIYTQPAQFDVVAQQTDAPPPPPPNYKTSLTTGADGLFPKDAPTGSDSGGQPSVPANVPVGPSVPGLTPGRTPAAASSANPGSLAGSAVGVDNPANAPAGANLPQGLLADQSPAQIAAAAAVAAQADNPALPSSRSFARDLWSGFTQGAGPTQAPSLLDAPSSGHTPGLALGMGLALGATIALCMGFGLAEARRRRALA